MWGETKRMFFNKNFLAAWLIACISNLNEKLNSNST